jgi:hypothetical protein
VGTGVIGAHVSSGDHLHKFLQVLHTPGVKSGSKDCESGPWEIIRRRMQGKNILSRVPRPHRRNGTLITE